MARRGNPATEVVTIKDLPKIPNIPAPGAPRTLTTAYWTPGDHPRDRTEGMRVVSDEEKAELARRLHAVEAKERGDPLRPGWLSDDTTWREHLEVLPEDDRAFLAESWELAGGHSPRLDTSWITMEDAGSPHSTWPVVLVAAVFAVAVIVLPILTLTGVLR